MIIRGGKYYRNIKNDSLYYVYSLGLSVTNNEEVEVVIYNKLDNAWQYYVRSVEEFKEKFMEIEDIEPTHGSYLE